MRIKVPLLILSCDLLLLFKRDLDGLRLRSLNKPNKGHGYCINLASYMIHDLVLVLHETFVFSILLLNQSAFRKCDGTVSQWGGRFILSWLYRLT